MIVTFLPKNFKGEPATLDDIKLSSIFFGTTIGVVIFTAWKAIDQTIPMVRRGTASRSSYLWMVWGHLVLNSTICVLAWLFMDGVIPMGYETCLADRLRWLTCLAFPFSSQCVRLKHCIYIAF
jgi:hypothetical protein